ncbi:MAG: ATP-binding protein [Bryobacteraceae bacterium]|nr:ATP-binding protein [Bryobacteraceae bacterium]
MTARIFFKLIAAVLLVLVVALTAIDFLATRMIEKTYVDSLRRELEEKAQLLALDHSEGFGHIRSAVVHDMARAVAARITVVARDGGVIADSEADVAKMENHADRPEIMAALSGRGGSSIRRSPTTGGHFLYQAIPIREGALRLALPLERVEAQVREIRARMIGYAALAFLPAIALAAFFARYYSTRLGEIIHYAGTLATGNFKVRLTSTGSDELGTLAAKLNETAEKLQRMFEELQHEHIEMEKLERIRKDFVINVSHELRTPLASIQGYTETLLDGALHDSDHNVRFLTIIRQNAERLGRLTADLLTLSRIELKTQKFQFASYYLSALLQENVDSMRPIAEKKRIRLTIAPAPERMEVFCDSEAVHQIMSNLLDNAIKYTPEGGCIEVSATPEQGPRGELVRISVRDEGTGIPKEDLPRLFERFYRVDKARSRELGGTGLGLAIVKHLVRAQGGEVLVDSELGRGSTFSFTLPVHDLGLAEYGSVQAELTSP